MNIGPPATPAKTSKMLPVRHRDSFLILIPGLIACLSAAVIVYGFMLPSFEHGLMERRKEATREMVALALQIINHFATNEINGEVSRETAQAEALSFLRDYHYGPDEQGYFWVNDLQPVMLMHPYREDLIGKNLHEYTDADGRFVFRNFVDIVQRQDAGFVSYRWQLPGARGDELPKLSYVAGFKPWGWIVGTGVYQDDLRKEVTKLTRQANRYGIGMLLLVFLLSAFLITSGIKHANRRRTAEAALLEHQGNLEKTVRERTAELLKALNEVKTLSGLLPICMHCKKIRDDEGYWTKIESYIHRHTDAQFSHGVCPDCMRKHYGDILSSNSDNSSPNPAEG